MPEDPLHGWQDWGLPWQQKPVLLRELGKGRTNRTYLVEVENRRWVLRINAANSRDLGIDRVREQLILEKASEAGLAPALLYCSVEKGVLVSEFIEGKHWQPADSCDNEKISLLLETLSAIHALRSPGASFDYYRHLGNYWRLVEEKNILVPGDLVLERDRILALTETIPASTIICHHDLNPGNVLEHAGKLQVLDWEYAAPGWPAFDYAALSIEWGLDHDQFKPGASIDKQELEMAGDVYRHLCRLWSCIQG